MSLARAQSSAGRPEAALASVEATIDTLLASTESRPTEIWRAELMRIGTLIKLKRWSDGEHHSAQMVRALEAAGVSDTWLAEARLFHGMCLLELGRTTDAERALLAADAGWRKHAPRRGYVPLTHRSLIELYETTGQAEEASAWRETARQWQAAAAGDQKQD
jgi:hypothetical protein